MKGCNAELTAAAWRVTPVRWAVNAKCRIRGDRLNGKPRSPAIKAGGSSRFESGPQSVFWRRCGVEPSEVKELLDLYKRHMKFIGSAQLRENIGGDSRLLELADGDAWSAELYEVPGWYPGGGYEVSLYDFGPNVIATVRNRTVDGCIRMLKAR